MNLIDIRTSDVWSRVSVEQWQPALLRELKILATIERKPHPMEKSLLDKYPASLWRKIIAFYLAEARLLYPSELRRHWTLELERLDRVCVFRELGLSRPPRVPPRVQLFSSLAFSTPSA